MRVAVANDYDLIVAGVAAMLRGFPDRIEVRDRVLVGEPVENGPIDVLLYDTYGRTGETAGALKDFIAQDDVANVAVFSLQLGPRTVEDARIAGCRAFISKALPAKRIVDAVIEVATGTEVFATHDDATDGPEEDPDEPLTWPGRDLGLSQRESEVLVLVAEGLTNKEIGATLYVGQETVKSHIANAFAKVGVRNRVKATRYVIAEGTFARFKPWDPT